MKLVIQNLCKKYGQKEVLSEVNATFEQSQVHVIMGVSGGGKTTLLRLLLGLEKADAGSIEGVPLKCAAVFQENRLCEEFSVLENLAMVLPGKGNEKRIRKHLNELMMEDNICQKVATLSGGMKRRVAIIRAVLAPAQLIIMDEPFKGLDEKTHKIAREYVSRHMMESPEKILIMVTHDKEDLKLPNACQWEMRKGKLVCMKQA